MVLSQLKVDLLLKFKNEIYKSCVQNKNELYCEVDPQSISHVCNYINTQLGFSLVCMFAADETSSIKSFTIYYVFSDRQDSNLLTIKTILGENNIEFISISDKIHASSAYEREIKDMFGLIPLGHPAAKRLIFHSNWPNNHFPLRKDYDLKNKPQFEKNEIKFTKVLGDGVYEIPVGPVHAGIIEPGHFRFSVAGEPIINLEAQLYYVHKGIEKLCEEQSIQKCLYISERISGDETFANSLAYCQSIEKIAQIDIPLRAQYTRVIFAELERLTSHLGDLAGICLDVAYGFAAFQFRMMRGWCYLIADELCGMRFLRSVNNIGGVRSDFILGKEISIIKQLERIKTELLDTVDIIKSNNMFIDRVENTGILKKNIAVDLNAVGPAARAAGLCFDVRKTHPYEAYKFLEFNIPKHNNGDVNCRMNTKIEECFESIGLMINAIEKMPSGKILEQLESVTPYKTAFGMVESPRGENIHWVMTGENNTIFRYKIRTPSFCNWPCLCHAVKGNIVPDFPLINKSFNLSYAGNDL